MKKISKGILQNMDKEDQLERNLKIKFEMDVKDRSVFPFTRMAEFICEFEDQLL